METLKATPGSYKTAIQTLKAGGLVALPTETVYGLAADGLNDDAVRKIYKAKGRPSHNPLIAHFFGPEHLDDYVVISPLARKLMAAFWPGPLTLVLPKGKKSISKVAGAGLSSLAVRCPDAPWAKAFRQSGFRGPIVMPSANRSGHVSPTTANHVKDDLAGKVDLIIDDGPCDNGIESTVISLTGDYPLLLRAGAIPAEDFVPYISELRLPAKAAKPSAPGMLSSHYAPKAKVRLNAAEKRNGEVYLAFGPTDVETKFNLSPQGDLSEAARNLYKFLRLADTADTIAVAPIPNAHLGAAINDRLSRAAAERN